MAERENFVKLFDQLADEVISELKTRYEMPPHAVGWVEQLIKESVPGGKMNRGLTVAHSLKLIKKDVTDEDLFKANVLGWCVEWLQGFFLVADDFMDLSITRRGKPCWYRKQHLLSKSEDSKIGSIAVNDSFIIESSIYRVLFKHIGSEPYYLKVLELFHEVTYQTTLGQLLDLTSNHPDKIDLSLFTLDNYKLIVKYKTAFYSFYLPVALAIAISGQEDAKAYEIAQSILLPMGEYFQIQDDFLDCYGDPKVIGKVGRDIEEQKCGWLVVQALLRVTPEQKQILQDHYGRDDPEHVKEVKALYKDLDLTSVFKAYEEESYNNLVKLIDSHKGGEFDAVLAACSALLVKIYKRSL